ncbi:hypothetical protein [Nannocystis pusilla]|uniref:hypothetical protein n=1 Tax=Nannocystis pusilla TaxID=889268 RepID=UPI003B7BD4F2
MTVAGDAVTTAMTCEVDGASAPASLRFAAAPEGPVDWEAGLAVRLRIEKNFEFATKRIVQLRAAADDAIPAVVVSGGTDNNTGYADAFLPLIYGYSQVCEAGDTEGGAPAQIDLEGPGEAELHLVAHHRGSLAIDAEHAYAVDVGEVAVGVQQLPGVAGGAAAADPRRRVSDGATPRGRDRPMAMNVPRDRLAST